MESDKSKADVLVVDLDDTLFLHTFWTRLFFSISKFWHKLALKSESLNTKLAEDIHNRKVIILTARNLYGDKDIVTQNLRKHGIKYEEIILCPRNQIMMDWKKRELEKIERKYGTYFWIDDMKEL